MKVIDVPTGKIAIMQGQRGQLEFLSIGDYGKAKNIKADFLGLTQEINGVPHGDIMPLSEKWVITISTQYGCSMGCKFCDVPKVGPGINATFDDMAEQITQGLGLFPKVTATKRLNVHFARMGEPTFNHAVPDVAFFLHDIVRPYIGNSLIHPVLSTMLPKRNACLMPVLSAWVSDIKNQKFRGDAGLQFSINSTDDEQREEMFNGSSLPLSEISAIGQILEQPKGRKFALNFALADSYKVDAEKLRSLFDPTKFMVKITPIHATKACKQNHIETCEGYELYRSYALVEQQLKAVGFDVLVFVPSKEEDESRITCGNAILATEELSCVN